MNSITPEDDDVYDFEFNVVNEFNNKYDVELIRPATYNYKLDIGIHHGVDFKTSLFKEGIERYFMLSNYKIVLEEKGLDFHKLSINTDISK